MRWLFAFTLISLTSAHSWLDCTNWIPNNPANPGFSNSQGTCAGWARRFEVNPDKGFGKHDEIQFFRHFDQRSAGMAPCRNQPSTAAGGSHEIRGTPVESAYAPNKNPYGQTYYPIGTVQAGQRVCWRWPAKNHVPHAQIPNDIEVNWANRPNYEPTTQAEWSSMKIATANFKDCPTPFDILPGADQTGVGSERRACGTCFTVPANFVAGTYSIQWRWIASATAIYTSCGDVRVTAQPPPPPPPAQAQESLSFVSAPTTLDARGTGTLRLRYNTRVPRQLVVDLLRDNTYQWYGKTSVAVQAGSGEVNLQLTPAIMPPNGGGYIFSSFLTTPEAWRTNEPEAWRSATRWARSNTQITGSLVPAGAVQDVKEKIAFMLDGVPSVIATTATSFDVGVALTTTGARSIMIELISSDKKTSYASVKFPVRQGVSSNLMLPIPITTRLPISYDNTSIIISDNNNIGLTLFVHLYNGNQLISSDNKTIIATGTTTLYPVEEKIAFVTDANGAIHSTFKAGSSVDILVSYATTASRTIWMRLIDASTGATAFESSADVLGGRGTVRISWQLPTTLTLNGRYQLQARLIDSIIFRVDKGAIEDDMGMDTTIDIMIGNTSQTRVITPENAGNSTIIENAASAPSTYDDVIGSSSTSDASTITMSFFSILLISFLTIQW